MWGSHVAAVYNTFKATYFRILAEPAEEGTVEEAMLVQWMDLSAWTYNQSTSLLDLTITVFHFHFLFFAVCFSPPQSVVFRAALAFCCKILLKFSFFWEGVPT